MSTVSSASKPIVVSESAPALTNDTLITELLTISDNKKIKEDLDLTKLISDKLNELFPLQLQAPLSTENLGFRNRVIKILDAEGNIRSIVRNQLIPSQPVSANQKNVVSTTAATALVAWPTATNEAFLATNAAAQYKQKDTKSTSVDSSSSTLAAVTSTSAPKASVQSLSGNQQSSVSTNTATATVVYPMTTNAAFAMSAAAQYNQANAKTTNELFSNSISAAVASKPVATNNVKLVERENQKNLLGELESLPDENPYVSEIEKAAFLGDVAKCVSLIEKMNASTDDVKRAFLVAARSGRHEIIDLFLQKFTVRGLGTVDNNGNTPLILAAAFNHPIVCRLLLIAEANPTEYNKYGLMPLHVASAMGSAEAVKELLAYKKTPLVNVSAHIQQQTSKGLFDKTILTPDPDWEFLWVPCPWHEKGSKINRFSAYAIQFAAYEDNDEVCKMLLDAGEYEPTALLIATYNGNIHTVIMLLNHFLKLGPSIFQPIFVEALHVAIYNLEVESCRVLLQSGVDPFGVDPLAKMDYYNEYASGYKSRYKPKSAITILAEKRKRCSGKDLSLCDAIEKLLNPNQSKSQKKAANSAAAVNSEEVVNAVLARIAHNEHIRTYIPTPDSNHSFIPGGGGIDTSDYDLG